MPNWCSNRLDVIGEKNAVKDFLDAITNPYFLVNADELSEEQAKAYKEEHKDVWNEYDMTLPYPTPDILVGTRSPAPTQEKVDQMRKDILSKDAPAWLTEERIAEEQSHIAQAEEAKAATGYTDWYTWNIENWGTKWSPTVHSVDGADGELTIQYETAWAPAQELLERLSEQHRSLTFIEVYLEEGMGFHGASIYRNGTREEDSYQESHQDPIIEALHAALNRAIEAEDGATEDSVYQAINDRWQLIVERNAEDMKALAKSELARVQ